MKLDQIIGGVFGLIILFLVLSRADALNSIINVGGGFVTAETAQLQGVTTGSQRLIPGGSSGGPQVFKQSGGIFG